MPDEGHSDDGYSIDAIVGVDDDDDDDDDADDEDDDDEYDDDCGKCQGVAAQSCFYKNSTLLHQK